MVTGRVLVIAGSDSGGGAGIQADIKTITALGGFATTAMTALTAQNTVGVHGVLPVPAAFLGLQIDCVLDDIGTDAFKTGMLDQAELIDLVAARIANRPSVPFVLDPVMVAKGGARLLQPRASATLRRSLVPLSTILTPNLPEAEILAGRTIASLDDMRSVAVQLLTLGAPAVLLKGGHLPGEDVVDLLATEDGLESFHAPRIDSRHTHGTGCTLASAIATGLAQGLGLRDSILRARAYLRLAMLSAPGYGAGHGPLDHTVTIDAGRLAL
ncbi:bifunctional hydroxymethylpyrimidine kinase/phosphomethylpyrimidine kinase [Lichenicoccus sp.]|uniref:bifunctional hydroxymethylpyrimidine kinase/phosphomethylpyrimidine kinase n=1 Tax=Lichenicoccus sp. TaxID=2781899 RepID=UPI003D11400B